MVEIINRKTPTKMKRISKNSDLKLKVSDIRGIGDKFIIRFYTTAKQIYLEKTDADIKNGYLKLNWTELYIIGRGVLNYVFNNLEDDEDYDDAVFNYTQSRTTDYYIMSDVIVTDEDDSEPIANLMSQIMERLKQLEDILQEDEEIISSSLNDLNKRLIEMDNN